MKINTAIIFFLWIFSVSGMYYLRQNISLPSGITDDLGITNNNQYLIVGLGELKQINVYKNNKSGFFLNQVIKIQTTINISRTQVKICFDDKQLFFTESSTVRIYRLNGQTGFFSFSKIFDFLAFQISISPDCRYLYAKTYNGTQVIYIYQNNNFKYFQTLGYKNSTAISFSQNNQYIISVSYNSTGFQIYKMNNGSFLLFKYLSSDEYFSGAQFDSIKQTIDILCYKTGGSFGNNFIALCQNNGSTMSIYMKEDGALLNFYQNISKDNYPKKIVFTKDNKFMITKDIDAVVRIYQLCQRDLVFDVTNLICVDCIPESCVKCQDKNKYCVRCNSGLMLNDKECLPQIVSNIPGWVLAIIILCAILSLSIPSTILIIYSFFFANTINCSLSQRTSTPPAKPLKI